MKRDIRNLFKPEDFMIYAVPLKEHYKAAEQAQAILNKALDKAVWVYGTNNGTWNVEDCSDDTLNPDTHQALLVQIEELPKKECEEHEPGSVTAPLFTAKSEEEIIRNMSSKCKHCGVKLVARWEKA